MAERYGYLRTQMPWQAPGVQSDEEYWQIAVFLAQASGADPGEEPLPVEQAAGLELRGSTDENPP